MHSPDLLYAEADAGSAATRSSAVLRIGFIRDRRLWLAALSTAAALLVGVVDWLTGQEISFSVFYLLPVSFAAWYAGIAPGVVAAAVSAAAWLVADLASGHRYSHMLIPYWNMSMRGLIFLLVAFLMHKVRKELQEKRELANQDFLTGVANVRYLGEMGRRELDRARRRGTPLSVAYLDLDNFKHVNDTYGHQRGDAFLVSVALSITRNLRAVDLVARAGGDEFVVLMPDTDAPAAAAVMQRLTSVLAQAVTFESYPVTFSIGLLTFLALPQSFDEAVNRADELMYAAKKAGKNRVEARVAE
jgi:diguanylate cyclase (GGDEF)-like protein